MRLRLLADWADSTHPFTPAGTVLDVDNATGLSILQAGVGERLEPEPPEAAVRPTPAHAARTRKARRRGA